MSSERDNPDNTRLVADTYRSLAKERAPEHLNQKVLRMAAGVGQTRYSRARAWIRPMAWAATIGLSVAIVLEVTRLPQPEPGSVGITAPGRDQPAPRETPAATTQPAATTDGQTISTSGDKVVPPDKEVLREAVGKVRTQAGARKPAADARADVATTRNEIAPKKRSSPQPAQETALPAGAAKTGAEQSEFVTASDEVTPAEPAATPPVPSKVSPAKAATRQTGRAVTSLSVAADPTTMAAGAPCPAEARQSAGSWLACIDELRDKGLDELAESELSEFRKIYPDRVETGADR